MANTARKAGKTSNKKKSTTKVNTPKKQGRKQEPVKNKNKGKAAAKKIKKNNKSYESEERTSLISGEIKVIAALALTILITLSNFGLCGVVGDGVSGVFFGVFGIIQYVFPLVLFLGVAMLVASDYSGAAIKKTIAGLALLIIIGAFAQLIHGMDAATLGELFTECWETHSGGGVTGGGIALILTNFIGTVGAVIVLVALFIIALVAFTQRSFSGFVQKSAKATKSVASSTRERMRENKEKRRVQRELLEELELEEELAEEESSYHDKRRNERTAHSHNKKKRFARNSDDITCTSDDEMSISDDITRTPDGDICTSDDITRTPDGDIYTSDDIIRTDDMLRIKDSTVELVPEPYTELEKEAMDEASYEESDILDSVDESLETEGHTDSSVYGHAAADDLMYEQVDEQADDPEYEHGDQNRNDYANEYADHLTDNSTNENAKAEKFKNNIKPAPKRSKRSSLDMDAGKSESGKMISREIRSAKNEEYIFPPITLLEAGRNDNNAGLEKYRRETALKLQNTLASFGVNVTITGISAGPAVTRYEMIPEQGTKVSKIVSLTNDIKMNLAATDIRIEAPIPGKSAIGIEVPNKHTQKVYLRNLIETEKFRSFKSKLCFAVGKDIAGEEVIFDLAKMPHLLIAGATGSGKSVCINTLIMSILYKARPDEVKLIMIDPKMVELSVYNGIPHLLIPVVTDAKKASSALNWAVAEMTNRYKKFTECHVRNIEGYNKKVRELKKSPDIDEEKLTLMPQLVVIIDELADLMMVAPGEVEDAIVRLSQLARAAGIHLVIATQRPSVNVITGLIKANVPSRIAFSVSSGVDSRTIIDMNGAEKLLGKGDMLFYPSGYQKPVRVQGALVEDSEVSEVVDFIKDNETVEITRTQEIESEKIESQMMSSSSSADWDEYFEAAARFVVENQKATCGVLQRMFKIGFNRAARIIDQLSECGIVGPDEGTKPRKVLMDEEQLNAFFEEH